MSEIDFAQHALGIASAFWGEPSKQLSNKLFARWGTNGSKKLDINAGTWFDHELQDGGGILKLVMLEKQCSKAEAVAWLEAEGFIEGRERENSPQPRQERQEPPPLYYPPERNPELRPASENVPEQAQAGEAEADPAPNSEPEAPTPPPEGTVNPAPPLLPDFGACGKPVKTDGRVYCDHHHERTHMARVAA